MELVTGYGSEPHITAEQDGSLYGGLFGSDEYVLPIGKKMTAEAISANTVRVYDGSAVMKGRHWWIEPNTYVDFSIESGTVGLKRNDILVARYIKDSGSDIETVEHVTKTGIPAQAASDPTYTKGDIRYGAIKNEMPLYRIRLDGVNISAIERISPVIPSITTLEKTAADNYTKLNSTISTKETALSKRIDSLSTRSQKEYYYKGLRLKCGTKTLTPSSNTSRPTLFSNYKKTYGTASAVLATNGNYETNTCAIIGTTYSPKNDKMYVVLNGATNKKIVVNYVIIYNV